MVAAAVVVVINCCYHSANSASFWFLSSKVSLSPKAPRPDLPKFSQIAVRFVVASPICPSCPADTTTSTVMATSRILFRLTGLGSLDESLWWCPGVLAVGFCHLGNTSMSWRSQGCVDDPPGHLYSMDTCVCVCVCVCESSQKSRRNRRKKGGRRSSKAGPCVRGATATHTRILLGPFFPSRLRGILWSRS